MKTLLLRPYGYCGGVLTAIKTAERAKAEHPEATIYFLGRLVHNEETLERLAQEGFVTLDERKRSLESYLSELPAGSVFVFGAHGHPKKLDAIAKERGLIAYDATCPFVKANEQAVEEALGKGEEIFYIGVPGHMEAEAILSENPAHVHLVSEETSLDPYRETPSLVLSQTTMALSDIEESERRLRQALRKARFLARRCFDAEKRQEALLRLPSDIGAILVLGSPTSNNSQKLLALAKERFPKAESYLVESLEALRTLPLKEKGSVALLSGASTPRETVEKALDYLDGLARTISHGRS